MSMDGTPHKKIKSTETAFEVIEAIADRHRPTVSEIAEEVGHSKSTVHYHLQSLQENRYIIRDGDGLRLGLKMAHLGHLALKRHRLSGIVENSAEHLAEDTGGVAHVAVEEGNELVWLYRSEDPHIEDLRTDVGMHVDFHCTAYGQAILAHLPEESFEAIVENCSFTPHTPQTITDRDDLERRLSEVRQLGFAYSSEEFMEGIASIASPIVDEDNDVIGAIGITDFDRRIEDPYMHTKARRFSDELPGTVKDTGRVIGEHVSEEPHAHQD